MSTAIGKSSTSTLSDDKSAFKGKRQRYEDMLADLKAGVIDAVMVWHEDRLFAR